ncbi:alkaline phosphatase family protein [Haladaptatus sp. DJG-WS-42]|uniref:alkaline phosphatase family protein n=1 Tax=Haladaptatus sp. DJG-WS-42 TaxID=3120516 RepID=UPI0030CECAE7
MTDVIVLGLDGATWDVLDPLIKDGRLPNIERVKSNGPSGTLESTFPPITAPAWLSMATSQNPGKTGVFYFLNREDPDSFEFESVGSDKFHGQSFWDVLLARGYDVGVFNFPMLYPPYSLGENGFMVSGLGSPEDDTITTPNNLKSELDEVADGYEIKVPYADPKYRGRPGKLESDLQGIVEKRERAIEYLLTEKRPDVFFGVISATDWAQHYFWRYHDSSHPLYEADGDADYDDAIGRLWERVDETVGLVADIAEREDATLLLVSDHGFGPVNKTFHSNAWLESEGFRVPTEQSPVQKLRTNYFPYLRRFVEPVVTAIPQLNDLAKSVGKSIRGSPGEAVDWDRSIAFAPKQNLTCGMIYMLSDDPEDRKAVVNTLSELRDTDGNRLEVEVYSPEDLYDGSNVKLAPDILFTIDNFACAVDPRFSTDDEFVTTGPPSAARSGGHRMEGIYCASGPNIESGGSADKNLLDIAPTILYALDEPIPEVMDGNVLKDVFTDEALSERSERREPLENLVEANIGSTKRDTNAVEKQLEDLGYI